VSQFSNRALARFGALLGVSKISPVAILATMIAAPITSAGRFSPRGPLGILIFLITQKVAKRPHRHNVARSQFARVLTRWVILTVRLRSASFDRESLMTIFAIIAPAANLELQSAIWREFPDKYMEFAPGRH
jgi:hypothetical protein